MFKINFKLFVLALVISVNLYSSEKDDNNGKNKINSNTCMSRTEETVIENIKEIRQNWVNSCNENFPWANCTEENCVEKCYWVGHYFIWLCGGLYCILTRPINNAPK